MTLVTPRHFVAWALSQVGAPYLWTGKGPVRWTLQGLKPNGLGLEAFDCSGLITCALKTVGGPDWRGTHNAARLYAELEPTPVRGELGTLLFYGSPAKPGHVAISLGNELILEAGGGDRSTTSLEIARRARACVRVKFESRPDFVGARRLPFPPFARS